VGPQALVPQVRGHGALHGVDQREHPVPALLTPAGRELRGAKVEVEARDFSASELMAFTPHDVRAARLDLSVFCPACRMLRIVRLDRLIERRGVQPLSAMKFRCSKCRGPGSAQLSWRDHNNEYRSFDFARAGG
jgi:hypothetical protein